MNIIKKSVISMVVMILAVMVPLSAYANNDIYGTYEKGMLLKAWQIYAVDPTNEFMNPSFEEGLRYWATVNGERPCDVVKLVKEDNNTFIEFTGTGEWSGLLSPRFYFEPAAAGQQLVVIYDWGASDDFQVYLAQFDDENGETRLGLKGGKVLYEAKNDKEWNTSITRTSNLVVSSDTGNENYYLGVGVQVATNPKVFAQVDNLRIGIINLNSGKVYDFDGNLICPEAYDDTESDFEEALKGYGKQYEEEKPSRRPNNTKPEQNVEEDNDDNDGVKVEVEEKPKSNKTLIIVSVIAGAVVLLSVTAVVVVAVILKRNKK